MPPLYTPPPLTLSDVLHVHHNGGPDVLGNAPVVGVPVATHGCHLRHVGQGHRRHLQDEDLDTKLLEVLRPKNVCPLSPQRAKDGQDWGWGGGE